MRTLVLLFALSAAALAQDNVLMASSSTATPEFSSSVAISAAPMIKAAPPVQPQITREQRDLNRRNWYLLTAASHGASAFDAWTTNRAIRNGSAELNPMLKPFAGSSSLYPVMQFGPAVSDYVGLRMRRSNSSLVRRMWWAPQMASTAVSITCGIKNLKNF